MLWGFKMGIFRGRIGPGAVRLVLLACLTACPEPRYAAPYLPFHTHQILEGSSDVCIVTQYTSNIDRYALIASDNHQAYAHAHGYHYSAFRGRISGDKFCDPSHPERLYRDGLYWQKITAVKNRLQARQAQGDAPLCRWVMWVDADVIFTNFERPIEAILARWETHDINPDGEPKDVVLPRDPHDTVVNAGVFFVRNSPGGHAFIDAITDSFDTYKARKLPEQEAIQDYTYNSNLQTPGRCEYEHVVDRQRGDVAVTPQREFNSFYEPTLRGGEKYWEPCDFIAHFARLSTDIRVEHMQRLITERGYCEE